MEQRKSTPVRKTLQRFLLIVGKYHVGAPYRFVEHFRQEVQVINQRINNGDKIAQGVFQTNP
ncbi:hypothetical protein D3C76_1470590 [compost metagenome]